MRTRLLFVLFALGLGGCTGERTPPVAPTDAAQPAKKSPAEEPRDGPIREGDLIRQYRHFARDAFVEGAKEDKIGTTWKVLAIDDDCIGIRLVEGRYKWLDGDPDKLPGYESKFCASDNYRRAYPDRPGKQQTLDEYRRVAP